MIAVVQRVGHARVDVAGETVGRIEKGLLVLLGVGKGDDEEDAGILADRVAGLRIFADEFAKMNRSAIDERVGILVVSQFTLLADLRRGRRPGFEAAERPERAAELLAVFVKNLESKGLRVEQGCFGAMMDVHLVNHGPATFVLDSAMWRRYKD